MDSWSWLRAILAIYLLGACINYIRLFKKGIEITEQYIEDKRSKNPNLANTRTRHWLLVIIIGTVSTGAALLWPVSLIYGFIAEFTSPQND